MPNTVIIGGGPAGLTAAYELAKHGEPSTVLEANPDHVGGIARTEHYKGYHFDIGGHRFFSKTKEIEDLWTEILGDQMLVRGRLSRIYYRKKFYDYPLKAFNVVKNLGIVNVFLAMMSYLWARIRPIKNARSFEDWTINSFGNRLYRTFFKTYTEKVWGIPCSEISADWAAQRIKGLSMMSLLKATLLPKKKGPRDRVIKTLIEQFRYPVHGPGEMWEVCTEHVRGLGSRVEMGVSVKTLMRGASGVKSVVGIRDGARVEYEGTHFLSSMPVRELVQSFDPPAPSNVIVAGKSLKYRDFLTVALIIDDPDLFPDNWIYVHDPSVRLGRVQNFKNWSPSMVPDQRFSCLGLEYFVNEGDEIWSLPDQDLIELAKREIGQVGLIDPGKVTDGRVVRNKKAYPVYDDEYADHVAVVRKFIETEVPNLQLIGRNGMHKYNNQDHAMMTGLLAARNIMGGHFDVWKVNSDAEYQEVGEVQDSARAIPKPLKSA